MLKALAITPARQWIILGGSHSLKSVVLAILTAVAVPDRVVLVAAEVLVQSVENLINLPVDRAHGPEDALEPFVRTTWVLFVWWCHSGKTTRQEYL